MPKPYNEDIPILLKKLEQEYFTSETFASSFKETRANDFCLFQKIKAAFE
jgi:hypothetical protein